MVRSTIRDIAAMGLGFGAGGILYGAIFMLAPGVGQINMIFIAAAAAGAFIYMREKRKGVETAKDIFKRN